MFSNPQKSPITLSSPHSRVASDVQITIFDQKFHLHSGVLRVFSGWFEAGLSETWWKPENTATGPGTIKYLYALEESEPEDFWLVPITPVSSCSPIPMHFST